MLLQTTSPDSRYCSQKPKVASRVTVTISSMMFGCFWFTGHRSFYFLESACEEALEASSYRLSNCLYRMFLWGTFRTIFSVKYQGVSLIYIYSSPYMTKCDMTTIVPSTEPCAAP